MIPRVLHHIWIGSPMPSHLARCVESWRTLHPGWQHQMWSDDDLGWLTNRCLYDQAPSLVPADAVGQLRADIARYEILLAHGGLYVDADTEPLRPVDPALAGHDAWAAAEDRHWVGNTYLACTPGHPVMQALVDGLKHHMTRQRAMHPNAVLRANVLSGPKYLTPIWQAHGCHVDPSSHWYPYSYLDVRRGTIPADYGDAWAVHHWDHTRRVLAR